MAAGEGQNIYAAAQSMGFPPTAASDAEPAWAAEAADYDYGTNTCSGVCGHYTQIVWRSTTHFGCGITNCTTNSPFGPGFPNWTIVVCNYKPAGNVPGEQPY
jgi:pathogenesis-related protein 1